VLAVSVDPAGRSLDLAKAAGLSYPLLSDPGLEVIDAYGVRHEDGGLEGDIARPAVFILDRQGNIVWRDLTDNWRIRVRPERILAELGKVP
jgi:peroxiredoxin